MPTGFFVARWAPRVAITPEPSNDPKQSAPLWRRLLWFVGLWGVGAFLMYLISLMIGWAVVA
jgi:fatty acid desaturase